ncbi:trypco2 family protein [Streptomyces liangshanensis]|uniref:trypco2 family protein n=1 Tax=Streptomyces liangshanensis TaxID=2717324 RepID=UPI0036D9D0F1
MNRAISLNEALREVRQELYRAQDEATPEQFRFEVEQVELTLEVEFRRDGNGKVNVEVGALGSKFGGEAGGGAGSTLRQTLTLTLQLRDEARGGERVKIRRPGAGPDPAGHDSAESGAGDGPSAEGDPNPARGAGPRQWEL